MTANKLEINYTSIFAVNLVKAFASVLIVIGGFYSAMFVIGLENTGINLATVGCIIISTLVYLYTTKVTSFKTFLITTDVDNETNLLAIIFSVGLSVFTVIGFKIFMDTILFILANMGTLLVQSILHVVILSLITGIVFVWLKWNAGNRIKFFAMGVSLSMGSYAVGIAIPISVSIIGFALTALALFLEVAFTSAYSYMDILWEIDNYNRIKTYREENMQEKQVEAEYRELAARYGRM